GWTAISVVVPRPFFHGMTRYSAGRRRRTMATGAWVSHRRRKGTRAARARPSRSARRSPRRARPRCRARLAVPRSLGHRSGPAMPLRTEACRSQIARWPRSGRHILAQYDASTVVVYQAYAPEIGRFAAEHGWFGGPFSYERMSWVKPNFLWMMYRSGWGTK